MYLLIPDSPQISDEKSGVVQVHLLPGVADKCFGLGVIYRMVFLMARIRLSLAINL